nr:MAG TPA: hypothetical protein [Caudoviricetes sp.]DAX44000.1 MAG TPA: hypothetical protein [Caudoviricetes sp.]
MYSLLKLPIFSKNRPAMRRFFIVDKYVFMI